ncbi:MAG TPA: MFS transporter [Steroidobacteraceae bacterium]|nr:MFS transporter [Steroidobacteraceae bacterium]
MSFLARFPALQVMRHGLFARYCLARFLITIAWQMMDVAVGWLVYALTHDPLALGLVGLSQFLPFVSLVLVGGFVADHADRRHVLLVTYSIECICISTLFVLTLLHNTHVLPIYACIAVFGATRAFWAPTAQAIIPHLVPKQEFQKAIAINAVLWQVAIIAGPALGGLLFLVSDSTVFGTCTGLFVVSLTLLAFVKVRARPDAVVEGSVQRRFLEGLRFVFRQPVVLGCTSLDLFAVLLGGATALLPIFAGDILKAGPTGLGLLRSGPGLGASLTAGLLALWPITRHAGRWLFGGVAAFGCATIVFGLSRNLWLSWLTLVALGSVDMFSVYVRQMVVQMNTPDEIRGRVSAVTAMFVGASNELGEFESGAMARWLGTVPSVVAGGCATLVVVGAWMRLFPQLRRLDRMQKTV